MTHWTHLITILTLALVAVAGGSRAAQASVVLPLSEDELVDYADTIVVGSVTHVETAVNAQHQVRTYASVAVHRTVRGAPEGTALRVDLPGGTYRGIVHSVSGTPNLQPGQLALWFLQTRPDGHRPVALSSGIFFVLSQPPARPYLRRSLDGLTFANHGVAPSLDGDLQDFLVRLDRHVARQRMDR